MNFVKQRQRNQRLFYAGLAASLIVLVAGWWLGSSHGLLVAGGRLVVISRLFGLLAAYAILLEVLLVSRVPFFEENFDLEESSELHRLNGYAILLAIVGHVVFVTLGYAAPGHTGIWTEFLRLNTGLEDVFKATLGTIIFFVASAISVRVIRSRLRYEYWYFAHLGMYGAILLTFLHQLNTGGDFIGHRWFTAYWYALYLLVFGLLAYYRIGKQLLDFWTYRFKITRVEQEADGVYSFYITGRNISTYHFKAGQYATWRILAPGLWIESHPFSFSSTPGGDGIRFTVRASGDFSRKLSELSASSWVLIDGPRGSFTADRANQPNVLLVAGGIGVAPYMSTIASLLAEGKRVTLLYAARTRQDVAFTKELLAFRDQGLKVAVFTDETGRIDDTVLSRYVSNDTTVFLCGPDAMSRALHKSLLGLGMPKSSVISERFAF